MESHFFWSEPNFFLFRTLPFLQVFFGKLIILTHTIDLVGDKSHLQLGQWLLCYASKLKHKEIVYTIKLICKVKECMCDLASSIYTFYFDTYVFLFLKTSFFLLHTHLIDRTKILSLHIRGRARTHVFS